MINSSGTSSTKMNLDFVWKLFEKLRRPLGFLLLLVLTFILQLIFDLHFVCSCQPGGQRNDVLYMFLPYLILTFAVYVVKIFYKKKFFFTVDCCICKRCCNPGSCKDGCCIFGVFVLKRFYELLSVAALWTSMVLFDGEWYFCVKTNSNLNQTGLPCKKNLTYEEERIKDSYKAESLDIGLGVCGILFLLWIFVESFRPQLRSCCHQYRRPYYEAKYTKILSDELSSLIEEELKKNAQSKAKEMLMPKFEVIRNHELSQNNRRENGVSQIWKDISDPSFIFEYQDMTERNQTNNTETSDQSGSPGRIQDGQEGQNLEMAQDSHVEAGGSRQGTSAISFWIKKASSSFSFQPFGRRDEGHLEKARPYHAGSASGDVAAAAEGSVCEGQRGLHRTASSDCLLEDMAGRPEPVEEEGESGESVILPKWGV